MALKRVYGSYTVLGSEQDMVHGPNVKVDVVLKNQKRVMVHKPYGGYRLQTRMLYGAKFRVYLVIRVEIDM